MALMLAAGCANETEAAATTATEIPQAEVCELTSAGTYQLNVGKFLSWAFDNHGVPRSCAQNEIGDETFETRRGLVIDVSARGSKCEAAHGVHDLAQSLVQDPDNGFRVSRVGGQRGPASVGDLLARRVVVTCLDAKPASTANKAEPFRLSKVTIGGWQLKLRGDQQSLRAVPGKSAEWKAAQAAQLSFAGDDIENSNKVTAKATLGLDSGYKPIRGVGEARLIPYVKFDSEFVGAPGQSNDVDKLAFGMLGEVFRARQPVASVITFDPQYLTDSDQESEIAGATLRYDPTLTLGPSLTAPGGEQPLLPFLDFDYSIDGLVRFGRVFDPGDRPELLETKNFLYYGPVLELFLLGTGFLEPLKVSVSYYHLWQSEGQFKRIENFTASAAVTLDTDGHMEFKVSYDNGRDFENFAEREKWLAALGYKF